MDKVLVRKLSELGNAKEYECWYLVKHPAHFPSTCYLVSFLKEYIDAEKTVNLENFVANKVNEFNSISPNFKITSNYRALRIACFFGLITNADISYKQAIFTDVYNEIVTRCNGHFERTDLYSDIIERQVEKLFTASNIDEQHDGIRSKIRIFPTIFLYKILLSIGELTKNYSISSDEYRYFVTTAKKYSDWEQTIAQIVAIRRDPESMKEFSKYRGKLDNRIKKAFELLPTLTISRDKIALKDSSINDVRTKILYYQTHDYVMNGDQYIKFLCSNDSMFDLRAENKKVENKPTILDELSTEVNEILKQSKDEPSKKINDLIAKHREKIVRLLKKDPASAANFKFKTVVKTVNQISRIRNPIIAEQAKINAGYMDEVTGEPSFIAENGLNYVEAHHIIWFNEVNGPDYVENIICLSPENHALIHHGSKDEIYNFYEKCRKLNLFNLSRFKNLITKYQSLNSDHVKFLVEQKIITLDESNVLLKLISQYGDKNSRPN